MTRDGAHTGYFLSIKTPYGEPGDGRKASTYERVARLPGGRQLHGLRPLEVREAVQMMLDTICAGALCDAGERPLPPGPLTHASQRGG